MCFGWPPNQSVGGWERAREILEGWSKSPSNSESLKASRVLRTPRSLTPSDPQKLLPETHQRRFWGPAGDATAPPPWKTRQPLRPPPRPLHQPPRSFAFGEPTTHTTTTSVQAFKTRFPFREVVFNSSQLSATPRRTTCRRRRRLLSARPSQLVPWLGWADVLLPECLIPDGFHHALAECAV